MKSLVLMCQVRQVSTWEEFRSNPLLSMVSIWTTVSKKVDKWQMTLQVLLPFELTKTERLSETEGEHSAQNVLIKQGDQ